MEKYWFFGGGGRGGDDGCFEMKGEKNNFRVRRSPSRDLTRKIGQRTRDGNHHA